LGVQIFALKDVVMLAEIPYIWRVECRGLSKGAEKGSGEGVRRTLVREGVAAGRGKKEV
jgi:hypothetical protein